MNLSKATGIWIQFLSSTVILSHILAFCFCEEASLASSRLIQFRTYIQAVLFQGIN